MTAGRSRLPADSLKPGSRTADKDQWHAPSEPSRWDSGISSPANAPDHSGAIHPVAWMVGGRPFVDYRVEP